MKVQDFVNRSLKDDKSESKLVITVAVAVVITVFCLVSSKTLFSQAAYNKRVLDARRAALDRLNSNVEAANTLVAQYQIFQTGSSTNIIGGKNSTDPNLQPPDGDNARLVLNALPSRYDFPALISSMTKILDNNRVTTQLIDAKDESKDVTSEPSAKPKAETITLKVEGTADYNALRALVRDFERSTRPFDITNIDIRGSDANMAFNLTMNTYFQSALTLTLSMKEIK
jgi:hypothetical protein